jgi:hypothetical protein
MMKKTRFTSVLGIFLLFLLVNASYAQKQEPSATDVSSLAKSVPPVKKTEPPNTSVSRDSDLDGSSVQPCDGLPDTIEVDMAVQEFLTCDLIRILAQPDVVQSFGVKPKPDTSVPPQYRLGDFPIEQNGQGPDLSESQLKELQTLLFSEKSYVFIAQKRCRFMPQIGLDFLKGQDSAQVLLSYPCQLWLFVYKDIVKLEDFDPVANALMKLHDALFPATQTQN